MQHAPKEVIYAICECSLNVLKGVIPLTQHQKRRLAQYKKHLRALSDRKITVKQKKNYLNQKGGNLLAALLPPVLTVLGSLLTK